MSIYLYYRVLASANCLESNSKKIRHEFSQQLGSYIKKKLQKILAIWQIFIGTLTFFDQFWWSFKFGHTPKNIIIMYTYYIAFIRARALWPEIDNFFLHLFGSRCLAVWFFDLPNLITSSFWVPSIKVLQEKRRSDFYSFQTLLPSSTMYVLSTQLSNFLRFAIQNWTSNSPNFRFFL